MSPRLSYSLFMLLALGVSCWRAASSPRRRRCGTAAAAAHRPGVGGVHRRLARRQVSATSWPTSMPGHSTSLSGRRQDRGDGPVAFVYLAVAATKLSLGVRVKTGDGHRLAAGAGPWRSAAGASSATAAVTACPRPCPGASSFTTAFRVTPRSSTRACSTSRWPWRSFRPRASGRPTHAPAPALPHRVRGLPLPHRVRPAGTSLAAGAEVLPVGRARLATALAGQWAWAERREALVLSQHLRV